MTLILEVNALLNEGRRRLGRNVRSQKTYTISDGNLTLLKNSKFFYIFIVGKKK